MLTGVVTFTCSAYAVAPPQTKTSTFDVPLALIAAVIVASGRAIVPSFPSWPNGGGATKSAYLSVTHSGFVSGSTWHCAGRTIAA